MDCAADNVLSLSVDTGIAKSNKERQILVYKSSHLQGLEAVQGNT